MKLVLSPGELEKLAFFCSFRMYPSTSWCQWQLLWLTLPVDRSLTGLHDLSRFGWYSVDWQLKVTQLLVRVDTVLLKSQHLVSSKRAAGLR